MFPRRQNANRSPSQPTHPTQPTQLVHPTQPRHQAQPAQATDNAVIAQPAIAALPTVPALPAVPAEAIVNALPADATLHAVRALPAVSTLFLVPTETVVMRLSLVATDATVPRLERVSRQKRGSRSSCGNRGRFTVRMIADPASRYHPSSAMVFDWAWQATTGVLVHTRVDVASPITVTGRRGGRRRAAAHRVGRGAGLLLIALIAIAVLGGAAGAWQGEVGVFGGAGTGAGQFSPTSSPRGIAVNDSSGNIYVADFGNQRIDEFDGSGTFIQAWGLNVVASGPDDTGPTAVDFCKASNNDVCQAGTASGQNGALQGPTGIAIDQSTGDVYVSEESGSRVDEFSSSGAFIRSWGWDVVSSGPDRPSAQQAVTIGGTSGAFTLTFNGDSTADIAFNASAGQIQAALNGLSTIGGVGGSVVVTTPPAVPGGGTAYLVTFGGTLAGGPEPLIAGTGTSGDATPSVATVNPGGTGFAVCNAQANPSDVCSAGASGGGAGQFGSAAGAGQIAVDPTTGNVYVADSSNRRVSEFAANGSFISSFGWGVRTGGVALEVCSLTTTCRAGLAGSGPGQFGSGGPNRIAVDSSRDVYVVDAPNYRVEKFTPSGSSFTESAFGPAGAMVTPFAVAIAPGSDDVLIGRRASGAGSEMQVARYSAAGTLVDTYAAGEGIGTGSDSSAADGALAVDPTTDATYLSVIESSPAVYILNSPTPPTDAMAPVTNLTATGATLNGSVNPNGVSTGYHFEYSTDGLTWTEIPSADASAGASTAAVPVSATLTGLQPNTTYLARLVATETLAPTVSSVSGNLTFTTSASPQDVGITPATTQQSFITGNLALLAFTVTNEGPGSGPITFTDSLASGLRIDAASAGSGSCTITGQRLACMLTGLKAGQSAPVEIVVTATAKGRYTDSASVAPAAGVVDPDAANNTASMTLTVATAQPPAKCVVPRLAGANLRLARHVLTLLGCRPGKVTHVHSTRVPSGELIGTTPGPGSYAHSRRIGLRLSSGRRGRRRR